MEPDEQGTLLLTEYYSTVKMVIMREGDWSGFNMTPELMKEIVTSYDPSVLRAPIVLDHVDRGPSFGHVLGLELVDLPGDDGEFQIEATVGLTAEGHYLVESGQYPERSVQIRWDYPFEGIWYLTHLSLLGAGNPRCLGMGPVVRIPDDVEALAEAIDPENVELLVAQFMSVYFIWDQNEEHIRYRVRVPSRFRDGSFRTIDMDAKKGIQAVVGKLKPKFVPEGHDKNAMVVQALLFSTKTWDLTKAKAWVKKHKSNFSQGGIDTMDEDVKGTGDGTRDADQIAELTARAESAESELAEAKKTAAEANSKLDRANVQSAIDTMLAAGKILPAQVEMGLVDAVAAIPTDLMVGDKSVRNVILECVSHKTDASHLKDEKSKDGKQKVASTGKVDNRDLDSLSQSTVKVAPGTIEVTARARELIAEGVKVDDAYIQAKAELLGGNG